MNRTAEVVQTALEPKDGVTVLQHTKIGPYSIVVLVDNKTGIKGVGQTRCSEKDKYVRGLGDKIAYGRALKAIALKKAGKELRNWYLG